MTRLWTASFLLFAAVSVLPDAMVSGQTPEGQENKKGSAGGKQSVGLRDVFLGKDTDPEQSNQWVGRLAVLLKTSQGFDRVRSDYDFKSGDRFRFEVAAHRDGRLYVLHAGREGKWQQLWPSGHDSNQIHAGQNYEIPPSPGIFIFDKDVGEEVFCVSIRSDEARPPSLEQPKQAAKQPTHAEKAKVTEARKPQTQITNFLIRDPFGETTRGVVFDPGTEDRDPYLYFSSLPQDGTQGASIQFKLHHVE